jgi:hypothetical protein
VSAGVAARVDPVERSRSFRTAAYSIAGDRMSATDPFPTDAEIRAANAELVALVRRRFPMGFYRTDTNWSLWSAALSMRMADTVEAAIRLMEAGHESDRRTLVRSLYERPHLNRRVIRRQSLRTHVPRKLQSGDDRFRISTSRRSHDCLGERLSENRGRLPGLIVLC